MRQDTYTEKRRLDVKLIERGDDTNMYKMERHTLKNVNNCLSTNSSSLLETSGGQSSNLYLNVVHFFKANVNYTSVAA